MPADPTPDPFAAVAQIAQEELELVSTGQFDALEELHLRRDSAMAALPAATPRSAEPAVRRALALQRQVSETLAVANAALRAEVGRLDTGRATVAGYQMSTGAQAPPIRADYLG